jgi:hypothetical protein
MIQKQSVSLQIAYVDTTTVRAHHASTEASKKDEINKFEEVGDKIQSRFI